MKQGIETIEDARAYLLAELDSGWTPSRYGSADANLDYNLCAVQMLCTQEERREIDCNAAQWFRKLGELGSWLSELMHVNDNYIDGDRSTTAAERVRKFLEAT